MNINKEINKSIRPYILGGLIASVMGTLMVMSLWDSNKSKYSKTEFCFNPPVVFEPQIHHYCQKSRRRIGLSSIVENEKSINAEFHDKVALLTTINPADVNLIPIGCAGVFFIWCGYLCSVNALSITRNRSGGVAAISGLGGGEGVGTLRFQPSVNPTLD